MTIINLPLLRYSTSLAVLLTAVSSSVAARAREIPDACVLLSKAEVAAVQREAVIETKSSRRSGSGLTYAQCFYTAATFDKSVSLEVTSSDPGRESDTRSRERWREIFHRRRRDKGASAREDGRPRDQEQGEVEGIPRRLSGLGDEAFWVANARVGALYVLRKDTYFRLSVGGWSDHKVRLQKTKSLARKVIARL
jgi:hypothetical protein